MILPALRGALLAVALGASGLAAQDSLPPWAGGLTASLGQPSRTSFLVGGSLGLDWRRNRSLASVGYAVGAVKRSLGSPVVGTLAASAEAYAGLRATLPDGGLRAFIEIPALRVAFGGDYNIRDNRLGFMLGVTMAFRRGGILRGGSLLRAEWQPADAAAFRGSILVPVHAAAAGRTRPLHDEVAVPLRTGGQTPTTPQAPLLDSVLAGVRLRARRLDHLVVPYIDRPGGDPRAALASLIEELRSPLPLRGSVGPGFHVDDVTRSYHEELARAFSIAASGRALPPGTTTPEGLFTADIARRVLLEHLLYPFNRLLGQWKRPGTFDALAALARGNFARNVVSLTPLSPERDAAVLYVFDRVMATVGEIAREEERLWGDSRLIWLPLQLGLRPEDSDTQQELDRIVEAATGAHFTDGNRIWYVINQQWEAEVVRTIEAAEDYHVIWIHDFPGQNEAGQPDVKMPWVVVDAYYRALIHHIREYDRTRRLPIYMIFLDQHYYEARNSRLWLNLLEHPRGRAPSLPATVADVSAKIRARQEELRQAVADSRLLQAEARQYGTEWLDNVVKVQVSITNPADASFWSMQIIPVLGMPDNIMRDHRKIVFYDVSEDDPYRGLAMYTGMGIGGEYVGGTWEDRAMMVQGPAILSLKTQARTLLESQGLTGDKVPYVLRARPLGSGYQAAVAGEIARQRAAGSRDQRAVELHNGTGFQSKQLTVAKAVLYSLMPPGSVVKVPDSLWGSALYASLLTGSALRGCRVLFIAPSLQSAPASNWPSMSVAHDLFARLIVLQQEFGLELEREGGMLKTGLYNPGIGTQDVAARFATAYMNGRRTPFLRRLLPVNPTVDTLLTHLNGLLESRRDTARVQPVTPVMPKLHLKASFLASREGWDSLIARPEMAPLLETYLGQLLRTDRHEFDVRVAAGALAAASDRLEATYQASLPPEQRARMMYYLMVGSANQDYRSMLMDGEASMLLSGWSGIVGLIDFSLIVSLSVWVDDLETLDALLPPPTALQRAIARRLRYAL